MTHPLICNDCSTPLDPATNWPHSLRRVRRYSCRSCHSKRCLPYVRRWQAQNPEKVREANRRWRERNPDRSRKPDAIPWRLRYPEKYAAELERRKAERRLRKAARQGSIAQPPDIRALIRNLPTAQKIAAAQAWTPVATVAFPVDCDDQGSFGRYFEAQAWCAENVGGNWRVRSDRNGDQATFGFAVVSDAVAFALRWGSV